MKTILVVDDEEDIRAVVKVILQDAGYKVQVATDGPDALEKLKEKLPDLMLVDMFMPAMSGRELCEIVRSRKNLKNLKCAFLTVAEFSAAGKEELKKMKILDYIKKPVDNKDLVKRIKKMIG